jgi:hypothetical protein
MVPLQGSGLAEDALVRKNFCETLRAQIVVPRFGEAFVFLVVLPVKAVIAFLDEAAPLLNRHVIVTPIERVQVCASGKAEFEAHLRVTHQVAILFAIVRDGQRGESTRPGLINGLDDKLHVGRIFDF